MLKVKANRYISQNKTVFGKFTNSYLTFKVESENLSNKNILIEKIEVKSVHKWLPFIFGIKQEYPIKSATIKPNNRVSYEINLQNDKSFKKYKIIVNNKYSSNVI
ncbi:MAG: hypothetical protein RSE41_03145 [Clostridia bacterium]